MNRHVATIHADYYAAIVDPNDSEDVDHNDSEDD
jgi:hypothetical protein